MKRIEIKITVEPIGQSYRFYAESISEDTDTEIKKNIQEIVEESFNQFLQHMKHMGARDFFAQGTIYNFSPKLVFDFDEKTNRATIHCRNGSKIIIDISL